MGLGLTRGEVVGAHALGNFTAICRLPLMNVLNVVDDDGDIAAISCAKYKNKTKSQSYQLLYALLSVESIIATALLQTNCAAYVHTTLFLSVSVELDVRYLI